MGVMVSGSCPSGEMTQKVCEEEDELSLGRTVTFLKQIKRENLIAVKPSTL